tara:strand:- start:13861 stop:14868 length:1008 start_codon:yes stop_codon:yes gene_type:complete
MPRNVYFSQAVRSEQNLYEDLIIESLKIYGQDVYYVPRILVNRDTILNEDPASKFDDAFLIEAYIENTEGFEGAGDLYSKFGLEIRDEAQFIISRKVWERRVGIFDTRDTDTDPRPLEGDLLFLPMTNSFFEISMVEDDKPFYQLSDLPVYKLTCSLFEYSEEDFDTGVDVIDTEINKISYQVAMNIDIQDAQGDTSLLFNVGDTVKQIHVDQVLNDSGDVVTAEVATKGEVANVEILSSTAQRVFISNVGVTNSTVDREFVVDSTKPLFKLNPVDDSTTGVIGIITFIYDEVLDSTGTAFATDEAAQNYDFEAIADGFIDFSESNPFGDPSETY